jgi:hypothetical protein
MGNAFVLTIGDGAEFHGIFYARLYLRKTRDLNGHQLWTLLFLHTCHHGACLGIFLDDSSMVKNVTYREHLRDLTFVGPRIVIYFYSKTNQMHNISNLFYFGTTLYIF